jgi:signal transduction histidine kinase/ActR/RegA family two-component response regulator
VSATEQRFVLLTPTGRDGRLARRLLEEAGMDAVICRGLDEAIAAYQEGAAGLFIAEHALGRRALERLASLLAEQEPWSDLPIVVFTTTGGDQAVIGARHAGLLPMLGNVTLLDRPLRPIALISAARSALRARRRQYENRDALAEQARAVAHRDQFLAMLGHELRNPLSAIQLAAEAARERGEERPMDRVIHRQTAHLSRLVDDLLDVSRVTSGKLILHKQPADLCEVVARGMTSLDEEIRARKLTLEVRLDGQPVPVDVDVVRIEQVLVNLVTNAIKYTPAGGSIRVAALRDGAGAVLTVADTGAGVSADMLDHIFDLFAQVDATLARSRGGLGIGLTLVRTIVGLHGGTVEAHSPGLGKGTTFIARLPLAVEQVVEPPVRQSPATPPRTGAPIVLVEDHDDSRELLRDLLQTYGHRVTAAANGRAGVQAALAERPEVMIIDIGLPELDGYGVARRVREALGGDVYLIALTGYGQPDDRRRAAEAGFDIHVTKPIDSSLLLDLLSQHIGSTGSASAGADAAR